MPLLTVIEYVHVQEILISCHGLLLTLKSNNGPQFCTEEFQEYCRQSGVIHMKITPKWPRANEEVEGQNSSLVKRICIAH